MSISLSCIILDDEPGARLILENYISKLPHVSLLHKFSNAVDAFQFLRNNKVDVILLDINMPEVDGFSLIDMLSHKPMVIFTTAYSDFALRGFEYNAIDYLQKPIRFERFVQAIEKAIRWNKADSTEEPEPEHITVKADGITRRVLLSDIYYIESLGNYLKICCRNTKYMVHMTMAEMEAQLPPMSFIRIHKSYTVNTKHITSADDIQLRVTDATLPIGKTYKKYVTEMLKRIK